MSCDNLGYNLNALKFEKGMPTMEMMTIKVPKPLFERLERMAELSHRPVAEYIIQSLDLAALPPEASPELQAELASMIHLADRALWDAAQPSLSPAEDSRLRQLNHVAGERELTLDEQKELDGLLEKYRASILRRARAFAILRMRGFAIPDDQQLPLELERT
jgi:hypothetical protein